MNKKSIINVWSAVTALALIILIGIMGLFFVIPIFTENIVSQFSDYSGDRGNIQLLLSIPTSTAIVVFSEIILLLLLVRSGKIMSPKGFLWVRLLAYTCLALAASFIGLLIFLAYKDTLPPAVSLALMSLTLFALAVSFVTFSLFDLLAKATDATLDLEGVI